MKVLLKIVVMVGLLPMGVSRLVSMESATEVDSTVVSNSSDDNAAAAAAALGRLLRTDSALNFGWLDERGLATVDGRISDVPSNVFNAYIAGMAKPTSPDQIRDLETVGIRVIVSAFSTYETENLLKKPPSVYSIP
jgi:hypothetical protein